ncbi:MAG TPA: tetratricopeptide repeat protein [Ktedonobacteraceae bacterium]|nr:tetratricopeptide repeat protein [Ktedonobacteraceae bacterium]
MKPHPLKVERELRGWSQARVAEAVGTNVRTVIRWEQGQTIPYPYYRERLCALYGKNARELGLLADTEEDSGELAQRQNEQLALSTAAEPTPIDQSRSPSEALWKVPPVLMPLIGRAREIDEIKALLTGAEVRLVTLIGAGGIGKTRLSIQLAHEMWPLFAGGICFVALTGTSDPAQVIPTVARELDLQDENVPAFERAQQFLCDKQMLLVLDNFEQVAQAAPELERLLAACPRVKMLVTSRVVLHVALEYQYRVLPLSIPTLKNLPDSAAIAQYASVELFVQRARTIIPTFQVSDANAEALAKICARLDGIPLAIELAAARVKLLPPEALLPRLSRSLQVLTRGVSTLPERQQTLRNTIRWSYDLLNAEEQRLFRLLSIFVGGLSLETAEFFFAHVANGAENGLTSSLDSLDSLIDKSLLQPAVALDEWSEPRLEMLETLQEYGRERLLELGEMQFARVAHAECYLHLAEQAAQESPGSQQAMQLERLDREYSNLQAVMEWILSNEVTPSQQMPAKKGMALRLLNALMWFWLSRGYLSEGWRFAEQALARYAEQAATPIQARAYVLASQMIMRLGNLERAGALLEQGIAGYRELGDDNSLAEALRASGWIAHQKNQATRAYDLYEQSLALFKPHDNQQGIANTLLNMAFIMQTQSNYEQARALLEEVVTRQRVLGNKRGILNALYQLAQVLFGAEEHPPIDRVRSLLDEGLGLAQELGDTRGAASMKGLTGWVAFSQGNLSEARQLVEDCLRFYKEGGDRQITGQYLVTLGEIVMAQGDEDAAVSLFEESMAIGKAMGDQNETVAAALEGMAGLAVAQRNYGWAVQLWAVATRWREEIQIAIMPGQRIARERTLEQLRALLGEETFTTLWEAGRILSPGEVWSARYQLLPDLQNQ